MGRTKDEKKEKKNGHCRKLDKENKAEILLHKPT